MNDLALIAVGSNMGDAAANVRRAFRELQKLSAEPIRCSSLWQSVPVDCPPGSPLFVNAAVALVPRTEERPESLLARLQIIEQEFGREPKVVMNEPRPLDLDLIAFGGEIRNTPDLTLPHPRAHQRRFVLQPLSELVPELVLPGQTRIIRELLQQLPTGNAPTRLP